MSTPLVIDYYSDVLCVWAWIAQRRIDELNETLKDKIHFRYLYVDIFGDVETKMETQWSDKGAYDGFSEHVIHSAAAYKDAPVNDKVWKSVRPKTSANAHMMLKAIELAYDQKTSISLALAVRKAFFIDAMDIGNLDVLCQIAKTNGLDDNKLRSSFHDGSAMAALMHDYRESAQQGIKGSPSYVLDNGRQTLYGNVGYRVLYANVEELLKQPADEASWC